MDANGSKSFAATISSSPTAFCLFSMGLLGLTSVLAISCMPSELMAQPASISSASKPMPIARVLHPTSSHSQISINDMKSAEEQFSEARKVQPVLTSHDGWATGIVSGVLFLAMGTISFILKLRSQEAAFHPLMQGVLEMQPGGSGLWIPAQPMMATSGEQTGFSLAISEAELAKQPNGQARVSVDGVDIMVVKEGSKVYAVQARCSHLPLKLLGSKVENGVITCSKHGSQFSCATGEVKEWLPGDGLNTVLRMASSQPCPLKTYTTQVRGGNVYVDVSQQVAMMATSGEKDWQYAITEEELSKQPNQQARLTVAGVDVMLVKDGSKLYAMQARCSHLPLKLLGSKVEKGVITCSKHGSKFSCATGEPVEWLPGGGINNVLRLASPEPCGLKVYDTKTSGGEIFIKF